MPEFSRWTKYRYMARGAMALAAIILLVALILWNTAPFGAELSYYIDFREGSDGAVMPSPLERSEAIGVDDEGSAYSVPQVKMRTDKVTFELKVPYEDLESAGVTIAYQGNPQELLLGVKADPVGGYIRKPVHNQSLNELEWPKLEEGGLTLFQRTEVYPSLASFLSDPPRPPAGEWREQGYANVVEYYHVLTQPRPDIDSDRVNAGCSIDASLRGAHTLYTYVGSDPLEISFVKQELNWQTGPDPMEILVSSSDRLIYAMAVPDDGDKTSNRVKSLPEASSISLPGLAEGVYKVEFMCGEDVIIKDIELAQGYACFYNSVYLADHDGIFGTGPKKSATLYSDAMEIDAFVVDDETLQELSINDSVSFSLDEVGVKVPVIMANGRNKIQTEMGGIAIYSKGAFFSFSEEAFFDPLPVKTVPYSGEVLQREEVQCIIAEYSIPRSEDGWLHQRIEFDLNGLKVKDGILRFELTSPGLSWLGGEVTLGSMEIILRK